MSASVYIGSAQHNLRPVPGAENAGVRGYPSNVEQQRSAIDVGDLGDDLACVTEGLVIVNALADELDNPAREGYGVEEAGVPEVHSREGGRLLRLRTRTEEADERQRDQSEGERAASEQSQRPGRLTCPRGLTFQCQRLHRCPFLPAPIPNLMYRVTRGASAGQRFSRFCTQS